jgi:Thiol-disulfide isomerase and thioredoxins
MTRKKNNRRYAVLGFTLALAMACGTGCASQIVDKTEVDVTQEAAAFPAYQTQRVDTGEAPTKAGEAMPNIYFQDEAGAEHSLKEYEGRVVVLNFWASWCPPCKAEMPEFQQLHQQWSAEPDSAPVLLTVNITDGQRETKKLAEEHMQKNGYTFPVLYDSELAAASIYAAYSIPMTYVIRPDGTLQQAILGQTNTAALEDAIAAAQAQ